MIAKFKLLIILCLILLFGIASVPILPRLLSFQAPINPDNLTENYNQSENLAIFNNQTLQSPLINFSNSPILGDTTESDKRIEVNLTNQTLYAYDGDRLVYQFIISSGKWDRTPTGTFKIWTKIRSQKMSGGSKELGTYYYLPNVPYILFFYNDKVAKSVGYSLHGTYWHNNFGVPMSHGCINMVTSEVAQIFNWAQVGTPVIIYGKYRTVLPSAVIDINRIKNL